MYRLYCLLVAIAISCICCTAQNNLSVYSGDNFDKILRSNISWFEKYIDTLKKEKVGIVNFNSTNRKFNFYTSSNARFISDSVVFNTNMIQHGNGNLITETGKTIHVKYDYDGRIFRTELLCFLENGDLDKSFFKKGSISKTIYKNEADGSLLLFNYDGNTVITGFNQADSTFIFIK